MLAKMTRTEQLLILGALILATLVVLVIFVSTLGKYIDSIQPTPTLRSLPPIISPTAPALPTLRPTSTPLPTWTPAVLPSPTP
jgi:hypothetical protein